jgi:hypothetical protein
MSSLSELTEKLKTINIISSENSNELDSALSVKVVNLDALTLKEATNQTNDLSESIDNLSETIEELSEEVESKSLMKSLSEKISGLAKMGYDRAKSSVGSAASAVKYGAMGYLQKESPLLAGAVGLGAKGLSKVGSLGAKGVSSSYNFIKESLKKDRLEREEADIDRRREEREQTTVRPSEGMAGNSKSDKKSGIFGILDFFGSKLKLIGIAVSVAATILTLFGDEIKNVISSIMGVVSNIGNTISELLSSAWSILSGALSKLPFVGKFFKDKNPASDSINPKSNYEINKPKFQDQFQEQLYSEKITEEGIIQSLVQNGMSLEEATKIAKTQDLGYGKVNPEIKSTGSGISFGEKLSGEESKLTNPEAIKSKLYNGFDEQLKTEKITEDGMIQSLVQNGMSLEEATNYAKTQDLGYGKGINSISAIRDVNPVGLDTPIDSSQAKDSGISSDINTINSGNTVNNNYNIHNYSKQSRTVGGA